MAVGLSELNRGALPPARRHFETAIATYRTVTEEQATRLAYEFDLELGACSYAYDAGCLRLLGHPDQVGDQALAVLERVEHGYSRSRGLYWISAFHAYRREWAIVEARAGTAIASAQERWLAMVVAVGKIMRAAAQAMLDPRDELVAEIREGLAAYRSTGARAQSTYHLILLAQALAACRRHGDGLAALREAAALVEETGERYVEAEIHRIARRDRLCRGRSLLCEGAGGGAGARGALARTARRLRSRPLVGQTRRPHAGRGTAGAGLWLVHRGIRHRRSERGEGAAGRVGLSR